MTSRRCRAVLGATAALLTSCGGDTPTQGPGEAAVPTAVIVSPTSVTLDALGATYQLAAVVEDREGKPVPGAVVTWQSVNPLIATVTSTGLVTAVTNGTVSITASVGALSGSASVEIDQVAVTLALADSAVTLVSLGDTAALVAVARDGRGSVVSGVTPGWTSSDSAVASVTPLGVVKAVGEGVATVTATVGSLERRAEITVEVLPAAAVSIEVASSLLLEGVASEVARVDVRSADGRALRGRHVSWETSNTSVLTVDDGGRLEARLPGSAELIGRVEGVVARSTIHVVARSRYEGDCSFCFLGDEMLPDMPRWVHAHQGFEPRPDDPREQIVVDESFYVAADQEVEWADKIVWVRPTNRSNIRVEGVLRVVRSLLIWDQSEHQQTRLDVMAGGVLDIRQSYAVSHNAFWVNWEYRDGSTVSLNHFQGNVWTSADGAVTYRAVNGSSVMLTLLAQTRDASVEVRDAHHVWFELFPSAGTHEVRLPETRTWTDWSLPALWPGSVVSVEDSYVYERDISINNHVHVTVLDTPSGFSLGWTFWKLTPGHAECELAELGDPQNDEGVYYESRVWNAPCNDSSLTIERSLLKRMWPAVYGNIHFRIARSNLVDPRVWGPSTLEIHESTLDHVAAYHGGGQEGGLVYLEKTKVRRDVQVNGSGSIVYGHQVESRDPIPFLVFEEGGGRYIELAQPGAPWRR